MADLDPAVVERMVALVRRMATGVLWHDNFEEAKAVAVLLPEPADPDLLEAREIVKATLDPSSHARCNCRGLIDQGGWDKGQKVRAALAALKRGRQLAREGGAG